MSDRTVSPDSLRRADGREDDVLRPLRYTLDFTDNALGSVLWESGRTRVLCTVCEEPGVPRFLLGSGRGWLTAEYALLPGSTDRRTEREATRGRQSGRTQEIQRLIGRSLRAVVALDALGDRTLWVDCDVLQADGGTRTAAISGSFVALALAIARIEKRAAWARPPLRDSVAAVSVGVVDGRVVLDLPYGEDSRAEVDMNIVGTGSGRLVEVQGTGEEGTFSAEQLASMTSLALRGIAEITRAQRAAIGEARTRLGLPPAP